MILPLPENSQCLKCARYRGLFTSGDETKESHSCEAFARIPDEIALNLHDHKEPFEGDGGLLFEEKKT